MFNIKGNNCLEFKNDAFYDSNMKNGHTRSIECIICSNNTNTSDSTRADNDVSFSLLNTCTEGTDIIYTNKCSNCTTVQSAYWCQVSARSNFNLAFLDLAANNYTNKSWEISTFHMGESIKKTGDTNIKNLSEDMLHETNESKIKWLLDYQRDELLASKSHNYASQEKSTWYLANSIDLLHRHSFSSNSIDLLHIHSFSSHSFSSTVTTDNISQVICNYSRGREVEYNQMLESKNVTGVTNKNSTLGEKSDMIGRQFGYIPFTIKKYISLPTNKGIPFKNNSQWLQTMHEAVLKYKVPNYQGARIPVPSDLNIRAWRRLLENYDLPIIAEYLEFGFPVNIDWNIFTGNKQIKNHSSAFMRATGVDKYFETETNAAAMIGPLENAPFENMNYSPLLTRDKPDGGVRVIVDLSWPEGNNVNSCIPDGEFDEIDFVLKYPSIDLVLEKIRQSKSQAILYKVDLQRAYRNLRIDPLAYPLFGLQWKNATYVDVSIAFGLKIGAAACQMCTDVLAHALRTQGAWVMNYLDDYVGVSTTDKANSEFLSLVNLLKQVGLPINETKVEPPSTRITCLGVLIDTQAGIIAIPDEKMVQIRKLCKEWSTKEYTNKKQIQSLIGKLIYLHRCVKPTRLFINRMLATLRNAPVKGQFKIPAAFYKDVQWFNKFLDHFNGSVKIHENHKVDHQFFVDASLQQVGAIWNKEVYSCSIPSRLKNLVSIVQLEAANLTMACKLWGSKWKNTRVIVWCDNLAVVQACQSHRIRDNWLMACCRTLWFTAAINNIEISVRHIYGSANVKADMLSRWDIYKNSNAIEAKFLKNCCNWNHVNSEMLWPNFQL